MNYDHLMQKVRHAANGGINVLSTGEALAAALVLNRFDWLSNMGYTMAEALDRIDSDTVPLLRRAERQIRDELTEANEAADVARQDSAMSELRLTGDDIGEGPVSVDLQGRFVTHSEAPGYRDATLMLDVRPATENAPDIETRLNIRLGVEDTERILHALMNIHRFAWGRTKPLDAKSDESRPAWLTHLPSSAR